MVVSLRTTSLVTLENHVSSLAQPGFRDRTNENNKARVQHADTHNNDFDICHKSFVSIETSSTSHFGHFSHIDMACIVNVPSSVDIIYGRSMSRAEPKLEELPFLPRVIDRLAVAAAELRRFLARVHFAHETVPDLMAGALYHPTDVFELAKARYERVWMPLLATQIPSGARLAAPLDVQWVHHLHRLDPDAYRADCERGFGRLIDPADPFLVAGDGVPAEDPVAEASARVAWSAIAPGWPF